MSISITPITGALMKKTFNIILPIVALVLCYLVYLQWFSPTKPLPYRLALQTTVPSTLATLPIKEVNGIESSIQIKSNSYAYTVFLVDVPIRGDPYFSLFKNHHENLTKQGYQIVYLWGMNAGDSSTLTKMIQSDHFATHAVVDARRSAQYQALGLQFKRLPFLFVCNSAGKVIFQQELLPSNQLMDTLSSLKSKEATAE
ncbi:MAG: hypothetical protein K0R57_1391 [Paenibacillaceae bacterium]|nr:hypothetical protein [Paenibacillaceae bacterium]